MPDNEKDNRPKSGKQGDTEASLQNELSREAAEGADSIGDVASNRTVSGSSSWETLPPEGAGKDAGQSPANPSDKKEAR